MKCLPLIGQVFGERIGKDYAEETLRAMDAVVKYEKDPIMQRQLFKAIVGERILDATFKQKMALAELSAAFNIVGRVQHPDFAKDLNHKKQGLLSFLEHNSSIANGSAMNIENLKTSLDARYRSSFVAGLVENDLVDTFRDPQLAKEIFTTIHSNTVHTGSIHSEKINAIKDMWRHTNDGIHAEFNANGLPVKYNENYVGKLVHSAEKISADKLQWKTDILGLIDIKRVAGENAEEFIRAGRSTDAFMKLIDKRLDAIYEKITKEYNPFVFTEDSDLLDFNDLSSSQLSEMSQSALGTRATRGRAIFFKNAEAEFEYRQKYSEHTTLGEMFDSSTKTAVRDLAFVKLFGPKPRQTFMGIAEKILGKDSSQFKDVEWAWDYATGRLFSTKGWLADRVQEAKYISSMAVLNQAGISSMMDFGTVAFTTHAKLDSSLPSALTKTFLKSVSSFVPYRDAGKLSSRLAEIMNDEAVNILLGEARNTGGRLSTAANFTSKLSGLQFVNKAFSRTAIKLASEALFDGNMSDILIRGMEKSYIKEADLKLFKDGMNKYGLDISTLDKIPLEHFNNNSLGVSAGEYRTEMISRLYTYLADFARSATSAPGASSSRKIYWRTRPDEYMHSALSIMGQYKGTVIKTLFNIMGAMKHKQGSENPHLDKPLATMFQLGQIAAISVAIAGVTKLTKMTLKEGMEGEDFDDWYDNAVSKIEDSPEDFFKETVQQSAVGSLFGDMFLSQTKGQVFKKAQELPMSFAYTPAAKVLAAPYEVARNIGDAQKMVNAIKPTIPLKNSPWVIPFAESMKNFEETSVDFLDSML